MFFSPVPSISGKNLEGRLTEKPLIVDVREKNEFLGGHISGAVNVPLGKIGSHGFKEAQPVYLICQSGMRSKQAAKILKKRGLEGIHVKGGMLRWQGATKGGKY